MDQKPTKNRHYKKWITFSLGILFGFFIFIPFDPLKEMALKNINRPESPFTLETSSLELGWGLNLGFGRGGLIGFKSKQATISFKNGGAISCQNLTISPQFLKILMGKMDIGIGCRSDKFKDLVAVVSYHFFSSDKVKFNLDFESVDLTLLQEFYDSWAGQGNVSGSVQVSQINLSRPDQLPMITWTINGKDIQSPSINSDFVNLPSLNLNVIETQGQVRGGAKLIVEKLRLGDTKSPIQADFKANFLIDTRGLPQNGELSGWIQTDEAFEKEQLAEMIDLSLMFGQVKSSGKREFKKAFNGNWVTFLMAPPTS